MNAEVQCDGGSCGEGGLHYLTEGACCEVLSLMYRCTEVTHSRYVVTLLQQC
jgi:hypothetical protein